MSNSYTITQQFVKFWCKNINFHYDLTKIVTNFDQILNIGGGFSVLTKIFPPPTFKNWAIFDTSLIKICSKLKIICQILMPKYKFLLRFDQNCNKFWSNFEYRGRVFCIDKNISAPDLQKLSNFWYKFDQNLVKISFDIS